jgi:tyrosinase
MGTARSARDPIFAMHHCNIDRIWAVWRAAGNADSSETLWRDMEFKDHFLNPDGSPYSPKVSDLLDYDALGYSYGLPPQFQTVSSTVNPQELSQVMSLDAKLNALIAAPAGQAVDKVKTFEAANATTATATQPLSVPVDVSAQLVSATAKRAAAGLGSGTVFLNFALTREAAASKTRAYAFIRDIEASNYLRTQYRVFIDCDYLSQSTSISDKHYVGTFGFFGEHTGHGDQKPSIAVDLTTALERLYGSAAETPSSLRVQILPVPIRRTSVAETGKAKPARVEVAFVSP